MKPADLAAQCVSAMNFFIANNYPADEATITLVLPRRWRAPPKFPRRELLCDQGEQKVYSLSAMDVLAWLAANGLVKVEVKVKPE